MTDACTADMLMKDLFKPLILYKTRYNESKLNLMKITDVVKL
jgi:hypothetical protein